MLAQLPAPAVNHLVEESVVVQVVHRWRRQLYRFPRRPGMTGNDANTAGNAAARSEGERTGEKGVLGFGWAVAPAAREPPKQRIRATDGISGVSS